jgi:protein arginine kinase activator
MHLCEDCAKKKGIDVSEGFPHFSLADLLAGLTGLGFENEPKVVKTICCPTCGLTDSDFRETGRLGCSDCYQTFYKQLAPLLKRIHGFPCHTGKKLTSMVSNGEEKTPTDDKRIKETIVSLQKELKEAIKNEKYEQAAEIRDRLRKLTFNAKTL